MPVLGKDIPWDDIHGRMLRVTTFMPLAGEVVDGAVVSRNISEPYGLITGQCPGIADEIILPILHKIDFLHMWEAHHQRGIGVDEELLVATVRHHRRGLAKLFGAMLPHLTVMVYPAGWLDRMQDTEEQPTGEAWSLFITPIAEWNPGPPPEKRGQTDRSRGAATPTHIVELVNRLDERG